MADAGFFFEIRNKLITNFFEISYPKENRYRVFVTNREDGGGWVHRYTEKKYGDERRKRS